jgi:flagellum-specific ATP synthase
VHATHAAHAIAEHFRDEGKNVLLVVDSITRYAMAQREVGLAAGEPPTSRGYPPSVFNALPKLVERGGNLRGKGALSCVYSVLVEGDDMNDPVADHMRALLDGHIVLSRQMANRGQLPAIDVLQSVSRWLSRVTTSDERKLAERVRKILALYEASRDLIDMGAHQKGANPELDRAVELAPRIYELLVQPPDEGCSRQEGHAALVSLIGEANP